MSEHAYIYSLCQRLQTKGKTPTTALIRNLADRPLALPAIIKTLGRFKADPNQTIEVKEKKDISAPLPLEQRVEELEQQLELMQKQLDKLTRG